MRARKQGRWKFGTKRDLMGRRESTPMKKKMTLFLELLKECAERCQGRQRDTAPKGRAGRLDKTTQNIDERRGGGHLVRRKPKGEQENGQLTKKTRLLQERRV